MNRSAWMAPLVTVVVGVLAGCGARSDLEVGAAPTVVDPPVTLHPPALVSPWPMRGHDAANRGRGDFPVIVDPVELWSFQAFGVSTDSPAITADGTLYIHSNYQATVNDLIAINPDGTPKWVFKGDPTDGGSAQSSPAIGADGTIYFGSGAHLAAVDPGGHLRWLLPTSGAVEGSPVVAPDGSIDVVDEGGHLYSVSPDGKLRWSIELLGTEISVRADPVVAPDGTVYTVITPYLTAVVDGNVKWTVPFDSGLCCGARSLSIADDGTIIAVDHDGVLAFRPDGGVKWVFKLPTPDVEWLGTAASIGPDGTAYVSTLVTPPAVASLLAIGPDGALKWSVKTPLSTFPMRPAVTADGSIYTTDPVQIVSSSGVVTPTMIPGAEAKASVVIGANGTFYTVFNGALHAFGR